ncbi:hypothetical protein E2C01_100809 [Portunus trituberculatus]|uniref:Uncharacterized protein n=1 Tax=Portunus trituberculatus TaxID=210409 RepID=A0A5B7KE98_PORTR|nr:hypothetical protein [Portunus trituberculatus]
MREAVTEGAVERRGVGVRVQVVVTRNWMQSSPSISAPRRNNCSGLKARKGWCCCGATVLATTAITHFTAPSHALLP